MLGMQLLLAQHYTVHFNEESHIAAHHHDKQDKTDSDDPCQICLFSQSLSHTLDAVFIIIPAGIFLAAVFDPAVQEALSEKSLTLYSARDPPLC